LGNGPEENDKCDLTEHDIEEGEDHEEYQDLGRTEEDDVEEEGIQEAVLVSS